LTDFSKFLPSPILSLGGTADLANLRSNRVWDRYFLADPARDRACRIRYSSDEYLVSPNALHDPRGSTYDELGSRLAVFCDESFVENSHCRLGLLLNNQVLFLIRDHRQFVEVVSVEVLDTRGSHDHLI